VIKIKVVVTSRGKDLNSEVDKVFGRCKYFIIVEIKDNKTEKFEIIENKFANQMGGAGISAAQFVVEKNVKAVITGTIGPRALDVLKQFNVEIYKGDSKLKEALKKFTENKLEKTGG